LEIVLKDIGVFDKVTYQIERNPKLCYPRDRRHVVFKPNETIPSDMFGEIMKSIKSHIGFEAPWWVRLFRWLISKHEYGPSVAFPSLLENGVISSSPNVGGAHSEPSVTGLV